MEKFESKYNYFIPLKDHGDRIEFTLYDDIPDDYDLKLIAIDAGTNLKRDEYRLTGMKQSQNFTYWWSPGPSNFNNPDKLNLGDLILQLVHNDIKVREFYLDRGGHGKNLVIDNKLVKYPQTKDFLYLTYWEIFIDKQYANVGDLDENPLILDIGSNYGFFSLYAIDRYKPKKIIAFEPNYECFKTAKETLKEFECFVPFNYAVTKTSGNFNLTNHHEISAIGTIIEDENGPITGIDINQLIEDLNTHTIDLVKIDCEGGELDIFETISEQNLNKIKNFTIEVHSNEIHSFIYNKLVEFNYDVKTNMLYNGMSILTAKKNILLNNKSI
jgi:FkbM family methyltransferase